MDELKEKILQGTIKSLETIGIKNLVDMIEKSHKEQREYGIAICSNNDAPPFGDIFLSKTTTGTKNNVKFEDCKHVQIGSFHTHIGDNNELSVGDIYAELQSKNNFSCMGIVDNKNKDKKVIDCFINAYHVNPSVALDFYKKQDKFLKQLKEYDIPLKTKSGEVMHIDDLLGKLSPDKKKMMYDLYLEGLEADSQLHIDAEKISKKHKDPDLIININSAETSRK
jgi:hypothetical protein